MIQTLIDAWKAHNNEARARLDQLNSKLEAALNSAFITLKADRFNIGSTPENQHLKMGLKTVQAEFDLWRSLLYGAQSRAIRDETIKKRNLERQAEE